MGTIHDEIADKQSLAALYAEDGAFSSASRVMMELATLLQEHAERSHKDMPETAEKEGSS